MPMGGQEPAQPMAMGQADQSMQMGPVEVLGDGNVAWRMPPMDAPMPPLPGIETAVPIVGPFLAMGDADPTGYPEAQPGEIVEMADGETLDLVASIVRRTINGKTFLMYGYNGQYPGPLIKGERGSTVIVNFTNEIEMPTTVHWHGLRLDNRFDGVPDVTQPPVLVGESFTHELYFRDSGIYWYHPHMREDIQQDLGLYGNVLVAPPETDYYGRVNREEVIILDDILMDDQGPIPWGDTAPSHALMGRFGNVMLINGATDYHLEVDRGDVVRFYITNVANSRTFNMVFGGAPVKVVGSDVSKFEREEWVDSVVIAPAERYIVEVRFETSGEVELTNSIQAIDDFMGEFYYQLKILGRVTVRETAAAEDLSAEFETLREHADVIDDIDAYRDAFDREPDHQLELTLRVKNLPLPIIRAMEFEAGLYAPPLEWNDAMPMMNWLSTAEQVEWILRDADTGDENMAIDWRFSVGDVVKIRIFNNPETLHPMNHPIHLHGQRYLVVSIDGVPTQNLVWKDTAIVPVGSTVDIIADMANPGEWMMHCHIAEHLHAGMMTSFIVQ
ncbi:MAG: multicopper oxidase family protein [Vicinamibacterales bacterium]|jgi:FtsP/CotA-like multicopper oxidase with cupredoxin domain|nr:multicopper oxidase family protein [Vicinamibacterales bacterium]HJO38359.1 multicopper oxidase family protein [Vicinamibacterales bacterium]|tara:strand:- start:3569 stop:5242 length:1674 start_codon:yes stop_codon:yes gene_type:complete